MQTDHPFHSELAVAVRLARAAGTAILAYYGQPILVEQKIGADHKVEPVTIADQTANKLIVEGLKDQFPEDGILAEESVDTARRLATPRVWMIDPLDGTNGFLAGDGDFAVQIGLTIGGRIVLGVVYQPVARLLFRAVKGLGAWVEHDDLAAVQLYVSKEADVSAMRLAASRTHRSRNMERVRKALGVKEETKRGSVGVKIGLIVERISDLYVHLSPGTTQWDTCAPEIVLTEAGGICTDLFGSPLTYNTKDVQNHNGVVASNGQAHDNIIDLLRPLLAEFEREPV